MSDLSSFGSNTNYLINVYHINLAELITILFNHAQPVNMGWLQYEEGKMSKEKAQKEAEIVLKEAKETSIKQSEIEYLEGRFMKLIFYLTDDKIGFIDPSRYDSAYGFGKALELLKPLLEKNNNYPKFC